MSEEKNLTTKEAAKELGVSRSRIYALVESGRLPATPFGNAFIFRLSDLEKVRIRKPGRPFKKETPASE